jgi:hypothetical protein
MLKLSSSFARSEIFPAAADRKPMRCRQRLCRKLFLGIDEARKCQLEATIIQRPSMRCREYV